MCLFSPSNCTLAVWGAKLLYNDRRDNKLASLPRNEEGDAVALCSLSEIPVTHTFATSDNELEICP